MTVTLYDAIVVGSRCAGAPTAMLLARKGYRVLLVDRAAFPSDRLSTHYIHPSGVAHLDRWGLLDEVAASGCPRITEIHHHVGDARVTGRLPTVDGVDAAYAPRRVVLDAVLIDGARRAGVEFRERCAVTGVLVEGGRVVGVRMRSGTDAETVERARLVVGADGVRSTVAGLVGAGPVRSDPVLTCCFYGYWSGVEVSWEIHERHGGLVAAVPTNDGMAVVTCYLPIDRYSQARTDAARTLLDAVADTAPELYHRLARGHRTGPVRSTGDQLNYFRPATGPGWALVGDAGHHKDSILARGITDAFVQAALLNGAIADGLREETRLDACLQRFAEQRDAQLTPFYDATLMAARMEVTQAREKVVQAVSGNHLWRARYAAVMSGVAEPSTLYTKELAAEVTRLYAEQATRWSAP